MKMFTIISILLMATVFPVFGEVKKVDTPMVKANSIEMDISPIITYKDMEQVMKLAQAKPTVLFFKADWCPSCTAAAKKFKENIEQIKDINLVVVNYDNSKDLQIKYGITYQHTFVQVSSKGNAIVKWNGGATTELLKKIKRGEM